MIFGYCRDPYEDELLYGYLSEMFRKNGFGTLGDVDTLLGVHIRVNFTTGLPLIKERIANEKFPDVKRMMEMTIYGSFVDGMDEGQSAKYAEVFLQAEGRYSPSSPGVMKDNLCMCPICAKEDTEKYGEPYLHVSHHIQGVTMCNKHKVRLVTVEAPSKRKLMKPFVVDEAVAKEGDESYAGDYQKNVDNLVWSICLSCGSRYLEHPYSRWTSCGCPFCNQRLGAERVIRRRLKTMFDGDYDIVPGFSSLAEAMVIHKPCGSKKQKLLYLLYGQQQDCQECKALTPVRLKRRFDPKEEHWQFLPISDFDRNRRRIRVKHLDCGNEYFTFMARFTDGDIGYCPYCDNPQKVIDLMQVDPNYKIVGDYKNNLSLVEMQHLTCGVVFKTSKNSFLAGTRCPICVPRYEFEDVKNAIAECAPTWRVKKEPKRGKVSLITSAGFVLSGYQYNIVMNDLKAKKPSIFKDRKKRYVDGESIRKMIYRNIKAETEKKGYWCFADGLDGSEVSRTQRNLVQDLARLGFTERIGVGQYRTKEVDYDTNISENGG